MNHLVTVIEKINANINGFVWSPFMLAVLLGTGLYLSVRTGFIQIFRLKFIMGETIIKAFTKKNRYRNKQGVTPFQALSTALAGTIGTGNIAGVAAAITIAGPGSVFWMWVSALFGMMTKYAEIVLAIHYRKKSSNGEWLGGPMVFIREGLNMKWLASIYAILGVCASFGVGNIAQANSISSALRDAFGISPLVSGTVIALIIGVTVAGGVRAISSVAERVVPLMSVFYTTAAIIVILFHFTKVPAVFGLIFQSAFKPIAPIGGFVGATVATAVQKGISRGIFTNEAGLGSASIAHAAADTNHPAEQGLWGIFEVFFDTIVMCSITAFAILVTDTWTGGLSGASLTISAFDTVLKGYGKYIIAISLTFFAFTSMLAWSYYGKKCVEYVAGEQYNKYYLFIFTIAIVLGSVADLHMVWEISDALNGLMVIPNIIGILCLSGVVVKLTRDRMDRF